MSLLLPSPHLAYITTPIPYNHNASLLLLLHLTHNTSSSLNVTTPTDKSTLLLLARTSAYTNHNARDLSPRSNMLLVSTTVNVLYLTSVGLHARTSVLYTRPHLYYLVFTQNHLYYSYYRNHFYVSYILYVIATCIRAHSPASASICRSVGAAVFQRSQFHDIYHGAYSH